MPGPRDVKVLKFSKRGGQRPEVKVVRVLGNQRLTTGGQIKRAKVHEKEHEEERPIAVIACLYVRSWLAAA